MKFNSFLVNTFLFFLSIFFQFQVNIFSFFEFLVHLDHLTHFSALHSHHLLWSFSITYRRTQTHSTRDQCEKNIFIAYTKRLTSVSIVYLVFRGKRGCIIL